MRGKERGSTSRQRRKGITPAHAGKRVFLTSLAIMRTDHPRTCGEKKTPKNIMKNSEGSPPHMRGKERGSTSRQRRKGITPAHAGKRVFLTSLAIMRTDHPRTCGEKKTPKNIMKNSEGSPPHMRGKEWWQKSASCPMRITPAHAGKRLKRSRSTVPHAAIVPLFPSVCNKPAGSDGSPAGHDAPPFLPLENAAPASPAYNLRSL